MSTHSGLRSLPMLLLLGSASLAFAQEPLDVPTPEEDASGGSAEADLLQTLLEDVDDGPSALVLSLDDALWIALENNLDLKIDEQATEITRLNWRGSWGSFDPVFTFDVSRREADDLQQSEFITGPIAIQVGDVFTTESDTVSTGLTYPFTSGGEGSFSLSRTDSDSDNPIFSDSATRDTLTLALTQPLLRGAGSRFATADQRTAEIDFEKQLEARRLARQELLRDVHNAYWDLVAALELRAVAELSLSLGGEQLEQNRRRLEVGVGTEVDVLQAEADVATREEELLRAQVDVHVAVDQLHTLLFSPSTGAEEAESYRSAWEVDIRPITPLPAEVGVAGLDWMDRLYSALAERPDLKQQIHEIERAQLQVHKTRTDRRPALDLNLSLSSEGLDTVNPQGTAVNTDILDFEVLTAVASLNFSAPLGNRARAYAERVARAQLIQARLSYQRIELTVASEVRSAVRDVTYQAEATTAAVKSVELARRQLEAEEARYGEGLSTTFQVLEFQRDLAQALSSEMSARAAYAKALVALEMAEGRLGEDLVER